MSKELALKKYNIIISHLMRADKKIETYCTYCEIHDCTDCPLNFGESETACNSFNHPYGKMCTFLELALKEAVKIRDKINEDIGK